MAKGDRKRSNTTSKREKATSKISREDATPVMQNEAYIAKEWIDQSNAYGKLKKQFMDIDFMYQTLVTKRKQIQKGEIEVSKTSPIYVKLIGESLCPLTDKKKVLEDIDGQLKSLKLQRDGVKGQLLHRRDEYIESALRLTRFLVERYGKYSSKDISAPKYGTGVRSKVEKKASKKDEETLFEAEFDKIMNDAETQAKFIEANEKAKKDNAKKSKSKKKGK